MSNLEIIEKELISTLESNYSLTKKKENEFVIFERKEYKSGFFVFFSRTTSNRENLRISIYMSIKKEPLLFLYDAIRFETDEFKNARQSLETPINMIQRAEDILNCIIVFTALKDKIGSIRRSKKRIYTTYYRESPFVHYSAEIRLDTNKVVFCEQEFPIDLFTSFINQINPVNFVMNRISKKDINEKFNDFVKLKK